GVVEHEDAERLGDELGGIAKAGLDERRVEEAHRLVLVVPIEALLLADEAELAKAVGHAFAVPREDRAREALPRPDQLRIEAPHAAEVEERDLAVGGHEVVSGMRIGVVDRAVEQELEARAEDDLAGAVAGSLRAGLGDLGEARSVDERRR